MVLSVLRAIRFRMRVVTVMAMYQDSDDSGHDDCDESNSKRNEKP